MSKNRLKNTLKKIRLNERSISRTLGALVLLVIGILLFNYYQGIRGDVIAPETPNEEITQETGPVKLIEEEGKIVPEGLPTEYTIESKDNLWKIAEKFYSSGYNWVDIAKSNNIRNPDFIVAGQKITLPKVEVKKITIDPLVAGIEAEKSISGETYRVQKDDSLWKIALRAYGDGYQWIKLAQANNLTNPNIIYPGNDLIVPR